MSSEAPPLGKQACGVHADRPAAHRCDSCGRAACLRCAIPFRGEVLCTECARKEIGSPAPAPVPALPSRRLAVAVAVLFGIALVATAIPWDRFGIQTGVLSAWRPEPTAWSSLACVTILGGAILAVAALLRRRSSRRLIAWVAGAAAVSTVAAIIASPPYVTHTPAPYAALACTLGALAAAMLDQPRSLTRS